MKALLEINFKPYAMTDEKSQGRQYPEKIVKDDFRMQFQHDRDRTTFSVLNSPDFPRLEEGINNLLMPSSASPQKRLRLCRG